MPTRPRCNFRAFGPKLLVACPQCARCDVLERNVGASNSEITLGCAHCNCARQWQNGGIELESQTHWFENAGIKMALPARAGSHGQIVHIWVGIRDENEPLVLTQPRESLRLWLQTPCGEENLWLISEAHLACASDYLDSPAKAQSANLDMATYGAQIHWISQWMKSAENRDAVLEALGELRRKLP